MRLLNLKYELYGQAADLTAELLKKQFKSPDEVQLIVNSAFQRDALSIISEANDGLK